MSVKTLTNEQWVEVCDSVELKSFILKKTDRYFALRFRAEEMFGIRWYVPPENINIRLRERVKKERKKKEFIRIIKLDDGRTVKVGRRFLYKKEN